MSDTVRVLGFENDVDVVNAITPVAYTTSSTPILSAAINTGSYPRKRILVVYQNAADATSTGVTVTVTESATSGGTYTAATKTGTAGAATAAGARYIAVQRNAAKPFIKVTCTPAGGSGVVSAVVLFIADTI